MVGLRCCCTLLLWLLSPRVRLSRVELRPPERATLTGVRLILHTTVRAFNESIFEIDDVCVDEQMSHREQVGSDSRADLQHVRCLIVEIVEQESQLATGRSRVQIMTEVEALCFGLLLELDCCCVAGGLTPLNPERDSAVLGARVARMAQR
jgi:hypothetical protein